MVEVCTVFCYCHLWLDVYGGCKRELGLGITNSVWTGGVLDVCLCFGCGGVGGLERWGGVMSV